MKALFQKFSNFASLDTFIDTVKRFPLSAICCLLSFVIIVGKIHGFDGMNEETAARIVFTFILGYFWFGISQIIAETRNLNGLKNIALTLIGFVPLVFITFGDTSELLRLFFIVPALLLLLMVSPYLFTRHTNESFWGYNSQLWSGVAISFIASLILAGGISGALWAIKYLFDLGIDEKIWGDIFAFCAIILGPIYALSFVPKDFDFKGHECAAADKVDFIVNWLFAPLVIVYVGILYAYFIKIGVMWEIPKGQLSFLIVGFLGAGLVTYILSWPFHALEFTKSSRALRVFAKYFFAAMLIPIVFQVVSILMRINQYGFTEQRYVVLMSAFWFAFIAIGFLLKKLELKHIPLSLSILLFLASWGPWSARDISAKSQFERLEKVLIKNNLLKDGKIVAREEGREIPREVLVNISGISDFVFSRDHEVYGYDKRYEFFDAMNIKYLSRWDAMGIKDDEDNGRFTYNFPYTRYNNLIDVSDADYYLQNLRFSKKRENYNQSLSDKQDVKAYHEGGYIFVSILDRGTAKVDLASALEKLKSKTGNTSQQSDMILKGRNDKFNMTLDIRNVSGEYKDGKPLVSYGSATLYVKIR